jgi:hypothetical protein
MGRLSQIESELADAAIAALADRDRIALENEADTELEPFRTRMPDLAYRQSRHQAVQRLVRQHFGIPSF